MERIRQLLSEQRPLRWLFTGDSITQGVQHTYGERDYTQLFAERIRYEIGRTTDYVLNTAISGRTSCDVRDDFELCIAQFEPDVVFVMIGMNDATGPAPPGRQGFYENLTDIVNRSLALPRCRVVLQTTCTIIEESLAECAASFNEYMDTIRAAAHDLDVPLIDHNKYWQTKIEELPRRRFAWMSDSIHPNAWGHRAFAELIFRELDIYDESKPTSRFFKP
jgi:lysophospholipase L1-like esterase